MNAFYGIDINDKNKLLNCLNAVISSYRKGSTIMSNISKIDMLYIITKGSADLIRMDYNGNKSIIVSLKTNDIFKSNMVSNTGELSIVANEDTEVIMIDYDRVINRCKKNCPFHNLFIDNILQIIMNKLNDNYKRIQLLTKKTIREKLLEYFKEQSSLKNSKSFKMDITFSTLATYLSVDRSALMRELKNLKEDRIIEMKGKYIKLLTN